MRKKAGARGKGRRRERERGREGQMRLVESLVVCCEEGDPSVEGQGIAEEQEKKRGDENEEGEGGSVVSRRRETQM